MNGVTAMKQTAPTNSSREALAIGKTAIAEGTSVIGMITGHPTGMRKGPRRLGYLLSDIAENAA
jgi:hypothetical protein